MAPFDVKTDVIENYLKENKLSKSKFCKQCKIGYRTLSKILNRDYSFKLSKLFKVANAMGVHILHIIEQ